ncbi:acyl-CoA--6-aminopenicillanic acid acyltransferase [Christiangramia fulva]|uniref:Acyl-CoA--6-aminopenicillanic acid acyltransferase n=1 Tax=Christiangramia fulva TaxID=2126553 RepID=A0A2R3Z958_9FLAO|nr:C45 family peptidase [Christiangramia fulva]AVR46805.1 acyl-CoA--6-aminopenicillanic acid acyltransferase [Christiangramia fulva]
MQLHFYAISEIGKPGEKWQKLYNTHWPAYQNWLESKKDYKLPTLKASKAALKKYMPEMLPLHRHLCKLVKADRKAAVFLTGFQPPAYVFGCAQAVHKGKEVRLIRNYDYHPHLLEGTQLLSSWNGKKVIATGDCLIGALDGINEDGLAISLSFGGRKKVGYGFGIPFILRYILEFCSTTKEAVVALKRIPSHMAYNVTVVDKSGNHKTVRLVPDKPAIVTEANFATNHQETIHWPENALHNQTLKRSASLEKTLQINKMDPEGILQAFLEPPLYNTRFSEGFGTLYTAVYRPEKGIAELHWPGEKLVQTFENFSEAYTKIDFSKEEQIVSSWEEPGTGKTSSEKYPPEDWKENLAESLVHAVAKENPDLDKSQLEKLRRKILKPGVISWSSFAGFWSKPKNRSAEKDKK